ncbi:hypothetical protein Tco_0869884, partial [Tanacetum coccineum]
MLCEWRLREKINHDGAFKKPPKKVDEVNWIDNIDSDSKFVNEVSDMMKMIGYDNVAMKYYFKEPNIEFDKGVRKLATDSDVLEMLKFVSKYKVIDLYAGHFVSKEHVNVDHSISKAIILNEPSNEAVKNVDNVLKASKTMDNVVHVRRNRNVHNLVITKHVANEGNTVSEHESDSEYGSDSDDSDFIVDEESLIHDVDEVNEVFNAKEDIDFEDFDSGTKSSNKGVRKKAIRQLGKMNKAEAGEIWKENLYVGQEFANSQLIKDMITRVFVEQRRELHLKKNDKLRVRVICRGKLPVFTIDGPSVDDGPSNTDGQSEANRKNPNTTVKIDVDRSGDTSGLERQFKRIYIFLGALKDGFRTGQRDCLRLDSYFLPVKDETKESWKWFLDSLCDDLDLFRNSNFTFITDRQKVLNMQLVDGMDKPIITCLEFIKEYLMKRIINVQLVIRKCNGPLTPNAERLFKVIIKHASQIKGDLHQATNLWGQQLAAIWIMASNGEQTEVPESYVHQSYWLTTWQYMYRFKVNPIDGPNMWPKSNLLGKVKVSHALSVVKLSITKEVVKVKEVQMLDLSLLLILERSKSFSESNGLDGFSHSGDALSFPLNYKPVRYQENGLEVGSCEESYTGYPIGLKYVCIHLLDIVMKSMVFYAFAHGGLAYREVSVSRPILDVLSSDALPSSAGLADEL